MRILIHIGLNKCASTYMQEALSAARVALLRRGIFYPPDGGRAAQYGLSRYYGFGPDEPEVKPRCLPSILTEARRRQCDRVILSSEYLSLHRPTAIAAFVADLAAARADYRVLMFTREVIAWVRSLFNQYIKTVSQSPRFMTINDFVDHVLSNRSADVAARYGAWARYSASEHMALFRIETGQPAEAVLRPFEHFAEMRIAPPRMTANESVAAGTLYLAALLRHAPQTEALKRLLGEIALQDLRRVPVPRDFLEIDDARRARLEAEVARPLAALPTVCPALDAT